MKPWLVRFPVLAILSTRNKHFFWTAWSCQAEKIKKVRTSHLKSPFLSLWRPQLGIQNQLFWVLVFWKVSFFQGKTALLVFLCIWLKKLSVKKKQNLHFCISFFMFSKLPYQAATCPSSLLLQCFRGPDFQKSQDLSAKMAMFSNLQFYLTCLFFHAKHIAKQVRTSHLKCPLSLTFTKSFLSYFFDKK